MLGQEIPAPPTWGPSEPAPRCLLLHEGPEASTLTNVPQACGGQWGVLRRPRSQQAPDAPCPPASVADVSSALLDAEAASGRAPRPGSGCAVGTRGEGGAQRAGGVHGKTGGVQVRLRGMVCRDDPPKVRSLATAGDQRADQGVGWERVFVTG